MKHAKRTIAILSLALAGCRGTISPASPTPTTASLRLLAEHSTEPLLRDLTNAYHPEHLLMAWNIQSGDLSTLTDWLKQGQAPFALTNYLSPESTLWSTPIGQDGLAIVVNATNQVSSLSPAQLRSIFTGRALNWKELGGADQPITVVSRQEGSSDSALFQALVMGERQTTGAARLALTEQSVLDLVSADRGAISYLSMSSLPAPGVRAVPLDNVLPTLQTVSDNLYPLRSPLLFVGLKPPDDDAYRAFFAWVQSPAGQAVVGKRYGALKSQPGG